MGKALNRGTRASLSLMRPHVIYNSINMSNLVAKLTNFYVVELRQHKTFIATYYAVKFLLVGIGAWVIHGNRGFVPMAIVCIAICAVTSTTCFLFSLRTLRASKESEARYRPKLRFNAELCSAGGLLLAVVTLLSVAATIDRSSSPEPNPTQSVPVVSRLNDANGTARAPVAMVLNNALSASVPVLADQPSSRDKDIWTLCAGLIALVLGGSAAGHKIGLAFHELVPRLTLATNNGPFPQPKQPTNSGPRPQPRAVSKRRRRK